MGEVGKSLGMVCGIGIESVAAGVWRVCSMARMGTSGVDSI